MAPAVLLASNSTRHVLTITTPEHGTRKLLAVQFAADGSIFVHLPYFESSEGYLALANYKPNPNGPEFTHFETPHKTTEKIKFSYHPDGRVHFSQDQKIDTKVISKIDPINKYRGPIFNLSAVGLDGFTPASSKDYKPSSLARSVTDCYFTEDVRGISITGFVVPAAQHNFDTNCALLASSCNLDYSVAVSCSVHDPPTTYHKKHILFLGGFVGTHGQGLITKTRQSLFAAYPPGAMARAFDELPSVDRQKEPTNGSKSPRFATSNNPHCCIKSL